MDLSDIPKGIAKGWGEFVDCRVNMEVGILKIMSKEDRKRITEGIAEYKHEQEVIKRVLKRHGRLSSMEFNKVFSDITRVVVNPKTGVSVEVRHRPKFRFVGAKGETFILGDVFSMGDWSKWLHLMQIMTMLDIVTIHVGGLDPEQVSYSLKEKV